MRPGDGLPDAASAVFGTVARASRTCNCQSSNAHAGRPCHVCLLDVFNDGCQRRAQESHALKLIFDVAHTAYAAHTCFNFIPVTLGDIAAKGDDTILHRYLDVGCLVGEVAEL